MLTWLVEEVVSPYGSVATLHWAVPDEAVDDHGGPRDLNTTELQVELESAEDQLGAVLWNSNPAALAYLHTHVFQLPPCNKNAKQDTATSSSTSSPPSQPPPLANKNIVELGAGVGCLGIALAMAGARVAVTDMKELLPLMAHNVALNATRVRQRSHGVGACAALQWKWGPTVSTSVHKQLQKELKSQLKANNTTTDANSSRGSNASLRAAVERVLSGMVKSLEKPSDSLVECSNTLAAKPASALPYHYVIMCDALYGNPKDWPALLYTLTELLSTNPDGCEIVNFCEQRVNDVEGAFLNLLDHENTRDYVPVAQRDAVGDVLWTAAVDSAMRCCETTDTQTVKSEKIGSSAASSGATSSASAAVEAHKAREEAVSKLLNYVLVQRRGTHRWTYTTEVVSEAQSELNMTIRATRIRWTRVKEGNAGAVKSCRRPREAENDAHHHKDAAVVKKKKH